MTSPTLAALTDEFIALRAEKPALQEKCQAFFAGYASDMNKPHYGSMAKDFVVAMLHRAAEAGLYEPPPPPPK